MKTTIFRDPIHILFWLLRWCYNRYILFALKRTSHTGKNVKLFVKAKWTNKRKDQLHIGNNVVLGDVNFGIHEKGKLTIGNNTAISGLRVECAKEIYIGNYCQISYNVSIHDNNSHPISPKERMGQMLGSSSKSIYLSELGKVVIEDNVWIGHDVTITKNVNIGKNSIVATGSIVTKDVPENSIVAGNPATIVKKIDID